MTATPTLPNTNVTTNPLATATGDHFTHRHLGSPPADLAAMLETLGLDSLDTLIDQTVPETIRLPQPLSETIPASTTEHAALAELKALADQNVVNKSLIGQGYHDTLTPPVILRNILENPLWYTPYTPYQAEISQGRLEALINFQTMVSDLTGLPLANASLLDEATAAAEAMAMCHGIARGKKPVFYVASDCHPQTLAVVRTRGGSMGVDIQTLDIQSFDPEQTDALDLAQASGILVQYPTTHGELREYQQLAESIHEAGGLLVAACDILSLCLLTPPGEWGADIAVGTTQRFGVPMGFGGPHAAYFATHEKYARKLPGRLIGLTKDAHDQPAYRLAIQTREQHIKRDKATSNICTAQVLLAVIAGMYAVWHGPHGLKRIAQHVHEVTNQAAARIDALPGFTRINDHYFDTLTYKVDSAEAIIQQAAEAGYNLRQIDANTISLAFDETTTPDDINLLITCLSNNPPHAESEHLPRGEGSGKTAIPSAYKRTTDYLQHPIFNQYHTEHELLRYLTRLQSKDISLANSMIALGSCTMKLNAVAEMIPVTWPEFGKMHPFAPADQTRGYQAMFEQLEQWLCTITGFAACSLQPNAGSQGEYAGLLTIRNYHLANSSERNICLIPTSAHGTNPASAVICGMKVVPIACDDQGNIDVADLTAKAEQHADQLAACMITYPSTHGVFESTVQDICNIIHQHGGFVYMDGANMNAQVGLTSPGDCGADVCHLNLHKTFCIPHGGGGPGMGPICCTETLAPHLPGNPNQFSIAHAEPENPSGGEGSGIKRQSKNPPVSAAPYGSPSILPISWMYIRMMGGTGLTDATELAILNANYMAHRLSEHYNILYTGTNGRVAHEFIVDCRPFEKAAGIRVEDIAKRLIDFGFHAPTMSWPVAGTLMFEPTESESKAELDRLCDAMIQIRHEIGRIEAGDWSTDDNPLKHAPHPASALTDDDWPHPYTRAEAAYPLPFVRENKYWPPVSRVDNAYGDRNLFCTCPEMPSA